MNSHAYRVEHNLDNFAVVRPPNVYGPGDNFHPDHALVVPSLMYRIHQGENPVVVWGDGTCERDFVYSEDVARGIIQALWHGTPSGFVNIGSGRAYTIRELVETLNRFIDFEYVFDASKPTGVRKRLLDRFNAFSPYLYTITEEAHERLGPHAMPLIVAEEAPFTRDQFSRYLSQARIDPRDLFSSIPTQCRGYEFLGHKRGDFPNAEFIGTHGLHVGVHQDLSREHLDYLLETTDRFLKEHT